MVAPRSRRQEHDSLGNNFTACGVPFVPLTVKREMDCGTPTDLLQVV